MAVEAMEQNQELVRTGNGAAHLGGATGQQQLLQDWLEAHFQLQQESHQRSLLLATAAHELKTPLAIIAGYVDLLLTGKLGPLNNHQRQTLQDSQLNCARLQRVIGDFLTCSTLDTGRLAMNFQLADLNACLSETYEIWLPRFQKRGWRFIFRRIPAWSPFPLISPRCSTSSPICWKIP